MSPSNVLIMEYIKIINSENTFPKLLESYINNTTWITEITNLFLNSTEMLISNPRHGQTE